MAKVLTTKEACLDTYHRQARALLPKVIDLDHHKVGSADQIEAVQYLCKVIDGGYDNDIDTAERIMQWVENLTD